MKAAPPKPMMAIPVAMPGRSGNHLISIAGNRRDVAKAEADPAEDAVAEIDDPEIVNVDADGRDEEA